MRRLTHRIARAFTAAVSREVGVVVDAFTSTSSDAVACAAVAKAASDNSVVAYCHAATYNTGREQRFGASGSRLISQTPRSIWRSVDLLFGQSRAPLNFPLKYR